MIVLHKKDIPLYLGRDSRLDAALRLIADGALEDSSLGRNDITETLYTVTQSYQTKPLSQCRWESHERWIDIQYIRCGLERLDVMLSAEGLTVSEYKPESDVIFYNDASLPCNMLHLSDGMLAVFYPEDIHRPGVAVDAPTDVEKVVLKIRV